MDAQKLVQGGKTYSDSHYVFCFDMPTSIEQTRVILDHIRNDIPITDDLLEGTDYWRVFKYRFCALLWRFTSEQANEFSRSTRPAEACISTLQRV